MLEHVWSEEWATGGRISCSRPRARVWDLEEQCSQLARSASFRASCGAKVGIMSSEPIPTTRGFDPKVAGRRAECDGGGAVAGTRFAGRQEFAGTLTGEYVDHGDPPWRWYLMVDLYRKPEGYAWDAVWCESGNVFFVED